ncbi:MAG: hypothetical protein CMJ49_10040 [Planctomycetaceae bacterium]|nr:hypothetical protein [Planctomycetaceae bacterium]
MNEPRSHRSAFRIIAAAVLAVITMLLMTARAQEDEPVDMGPDVVILRELQDIYEPVPFDHKSHAQMAQMWYGCVTCHHRPPHPTETDPNDDATAPPPRAHTQEESEQIPACKSCHPVSGEDTDIRMPSLKGAYHRQCLNCHKDWSDANNCVVCHEPIEGRDPASAEPTPGDVIARMHPPLDPPNVKVYRTRFTPVDGSNVMFRHDEHVARFGLTCVDCHHGDTCANCHQPAATPGRHKVLRPARSWRQSHGPCMSCHQGQSCRHCHYHDDEEPPPSFDHQTTGQTLDEDHATFGCRPCHQQLDFQAQPSCDTAGCHDRDEPITFPDDRPGAVLAMPAPDENLTPTSPVTIKGPRVMPDWYRDRYGIDETDVAQSTNEPPPTSDDINTPPPTALTTTPDVEPPELPPLALKHGRPTQIVAANRCATPDCHAAVKMSAYVHGPVSIDACDVCHQPLDVETHTFRMLRDGPELCTYCHEFAGRPMPVMHKPVERGECLGCHDPHGGHDRTLTREDSIPQLCGRCHDSAAWNRSAPHAPVADGRCVSCHAPHGSVFPGLLDATGPDLCLACHDKFDRRLGDVRFMHKALEDGCKVCHDVHGSDFPMTIRQPLTATCAKCHEEVENRATGAQYSHSVVTTDRACLNCHTPHGGNVPALMIDRQADVCMQCHDEEIDLADGRTVKATPEVMDPQVRKHGPIRDDECSACHEPHGSDRALLLAKSYDWDIAPQFTMPANELCFDCHDKRLAEDQRLDGVTHFRDGDMNLHYVHLARRSWVRYCPACHSPHGSRQDQNVRQFVSFGQWQLPIQFERTATGGTCTPGCHLPFDYDREQPVGYDRQKPASDDPRHAAPTTALHAKIVRITMPAPDGDAAQQWKITSWQAKDATGRALVVPDPQRPSILLFLRPDAPQAKATLQVLAAALQPRASMQTIVILNGESMPQQWAVVTQDSPESWAVVMDPDARLAQQLGVSAWPTVFIVRHDGVVASVGGTAPSLTTKLNAYIDWATGKATSPAIDEQPTEHQTISDTLPRQTAWVLFTAQNMLDEGNAAQAAQSLNDAIKRQPDSTPLQIALIEAMISADQADEAIDRFDQLPSGAMPPGRSVLLRARLLTAMDRTTEALDLLRELLADDPDLADAHFLTGLIHQAQGNWEEAAAAFRAAHDSR